MPDRFLRPGITREERSAFFHMLEVGFLKYTIIIAISVSLIMSVLVSFPAAIIVSNNTNHINKASHNQNCDNINAIDNTLIGVIEKSPPHNKKEAAAKADLLQKLERAHCKYVH